MPIKCPACRREYDTSRSGSASEIVCVCGAKLGLKNEEVFAQLAQICRHYDLQVEEDKLTEIKSAQDRTVFLILNTDYGAVDIDIEKERFRELI